MADERRWTIEVPEGDASQRLRALEPTESEVRTAAPALAAFYDEPHNRRMLGNTVPLSADDVVSIYAELRAAGGRPLLFYEGARLLGDGDVRHIDGDVGEVALLVGARAEQGRGLGTRFAILLHAFAFTVLGLERLYASIAPANTASLRLFARLGYQRDEGDAGRTFADEPDDHVLSVTRATFTSRHADVLARVRATPRAR